MKIKLSISAFAKLCNISSETLRHYDRVGLLKPFEVDSKTGYRYYSILQYEKLSTIIELRNINIGIDEIKVYFDNMNIKKSKEILRKKQKEILKKIEELKTLEQNMGH